jgi:murein L,D-transpeptidase YcbB/YkuD
LAGGSRFFSHGCIRVAKPKELAAMIMKNDKNGMQKIETAMNSGEEYWYTLKKKFGIHWLFHRLGRC